MRSPPAPRKVLRALILAGAGLLLVPVEARPVEAAFGEADLTPPVGVPLAGFSARRRTFPDLFGSDPYAFWMKASTGIRHPIRARALWLRTTDDSADPVDLAFVSLDLVGVDPWVRRRVADGLVATGAAPDLLMLSATHTHSGPGAMSPNWLFELLVTDRFDEAVAAPFADGVVELIGSLPPRLVEAELSTLSLLTASLQKNRLHPGGAVDRHLRALLVSRPGGGELLGALVNFAIHGTVLGASNLEYDPDIPGAIERNLEAALQRARGGAPAVVFLNGAEGDVSPSMHDPDEMELKTVQLADEVVAALATASPLDGPAAWRRTEIPLRNAFISLGNCSVGPWSRLGLRATSAMPRAAPIGQLDLGRLRMLTVPGEATTAIGEELRGLPHPASSEVWIVGLTDAHLGYFAKPDEWGPHASGCGTFYGPNVGDRLVAGHRCLLGGGCP